MDRYLRASLICFLIAGIAFWGLVTVGSGGKVMAWWNFWKAPISIEGVCKHQTTYAAYTFAEKYPVRVAIGLRSIYGKAGLHVQAQALIDGKWEWLNIKYPFVQVGVQDSDFEVLRYTTLRTWFDFNVFDTVLEVNK